MHNIMLKTLIGSVLFGAFLTIIQIWFMPVEWIVFGKAIGTLGVVFLVAGFMMVVGSDFGNKKNLKDENYLD